MKHTYKRLTSQDKCPAQYNETIEEIGKKQTILNSKQMDVLMRSKAKIHSLKNEFGLHELSFIYREKKSR